MTTQPTPDEPLDFDAPATPGLGSTTCAACKAPVAGEYWTVGDAVLCGTCKQTIEECQVVPAGIAARAGRLGRATLLGLGGMFAGALVWWAVAKFANIEAGLIAILLGWLVGKAVLRGSGHRGGLRYQILAVVLTYLGIGVSYAPFVFEGVHESAMADPVAAAQVDSTVQFALPDGAVAPAVAAQPEPDSASAAQPQSLRFGDFALGIGALGAMIVILPAMVAIGGLPGSILSLIIYGVALVQAWQLPAARRLAFGGPFKVGGAAAS
jgi:hypothetical protein